MKAYHIEKACDPSDLPEWLFGEHERRPVGRSRFTSRQNGSQGDRYEESTPLRPRGLQDIYEAAASPSSNSRPSGLSDRTPNRFTDESAPSKATNRLKALRDAKRQNSRFDNDAPSPGSDRRDGDGRHRDGRGAEADRRPHPRVGLPSGPGGRRI